MPLTEKTLNLLNRKFPWPDVRPDCNPSEWILDGGGRELIGNRIIKNDVCLVIEIGVFLGSSVKKWLAVSPKVHVIAIDPWEGKWWSEYALKHGRNELAVQFENNDGPFMTFLASLWEYRERVIPVRGTSPDKLYELAKMGIVPDLIYFDSDKTGLDIEIAHKLFPSAIITGDDWTWRKGNEYPIRKAVKKFARKYGKFVRSSRATWVLDQTCYSMADHLNSCIEFARDQARIFKGALRRLMK